MHLGRVNELFARKTLLTIAEFVIRRRSHIHGSTLSVSEDVLPDQELEFYICCKASSGWMAYECASSARNNRL
jgi:hypothetical protein